MAAQKTMGTTLTKTTGTPNTIAGLTSIGEIGTESGEIDVTTLDSPDGFREFLAGLKDGGEIPFEGFVTTESDFEALMDLADAQTNESWEVEWPDGAKAWFVAFVKSCKTSATEVEGAKGFTGTFRVSGKPVYSSTGISA